jgi:YgiT-type zinc finger domain-containing protein
MARPIYQESKMKCAICQHGQTESGFTTVTLERNQTTLVFKQVPAEICDNCGEVYLSSKANRSLLEQAEKELQRGVVLEMVNYCF